MRAIPGLPRFALVIASLLILSNARAAQSEMRRFSIESLAWMAGSWSWATDSTSSEEIWMAPRAGTMVGMNRETRPRRSPFFEFLRIEARDDGIFYIASPRDAEPTEFRLVESSGDSAVFSNPDHDYPQRIIYRRVAPDTLAARIEGEVDGELKSSAWRWRRVVDNDTRYDAHTQGMHRER